jgi:hypothetical protein
VEDRVQKTLREKLSDSTIHYDSPGQRVDWITEDGCCGYVSQRLNTPNPTQIIQYRGRSQTVEMAATKQGAIDQSNQFVFDELVMARKHLRKIAGWPVCLNVCMCVCIINPFTIIIHTK